MPTRDQLKGFLGRHALILLILLGAGLGFAIGFGVRELNPSDDVIMWVGLPGEIFMNLMKMIVIPLIVTSIITGIAASDFKSKGRLGLVTIGLYLLWNMLGVIIGCAAFFVFRPGKEDINVNEKALTLSTTSIRTGDIFADLIRNFFPDSIITFTFRKTQTSYREDTPTGNSSDATYTRVVGYVDNSNILGAVVVSVLIGIAAEKTEGSKQFFVPFFQASMNICMHMMTWFIWVTPVGVASFIAVSLLRVQDIHGQFQGLGMFVLTFLICCFLQQAICLPLFFFCVFRRSPIRFLKSLGQPWVTVFGPPSTAIGMPIIIQVTESSLKIRSVVSRFVVPMGATICRTGSVMFIMLSCLYVAYSSGKPIPPSNVVLVVILSFVGTLAIPAVPSGSLITILIILKSLDIPYQGLGMIIAIDWFSDRIRTTTNTTYVMLTTVMADHFCDRNKGYNDTMDATDEEKEQMNDGNPNLQIIQISDKKDCKQSHKFVAKF